MKKHFFVTSSGTDCGKTWVGCLLAAAAHAEGDAVAVLKPVISGYEDAHWDDSDGAQLLRASGGVPSQTAVEQLSAYRFAASLSPHLAACAEGTQIDPEALLCWCRDRLAENADGIVLMEGAGGIMAPLALGFHQGHLVQALGLPCVLVVGTYLGAISHGLTAYHVLQQWGCEVHAVFINESAAPALSLAQAEEVFRAFTSPQQKIISVARQSLDVARFHAHYWQQCVQNNLQIMEFYHD